ncbi:MAG: DNA adenine methylase, partial [Candidatus Marsarchaeota archaeon]|nr:DNA adenine methylase [Candidatus Marsarchaeota archaeon]
FGGAASLLFAKKSSPVEVYNDLNSDLANFMRVLRDRDGMFPDFYNRACLSPYSRQEWLFCREHLNDDPDPVERARRFFVLARFSFSGLVGGSFGIDVVGSKGGMVQKASAYQGVLGILPRLSERLVSVLIENRDFRKVIEQYDTPTTLFYIDPPYLPETRRSGAYEHELTSDDHRELVEILRHVKGKVMLSGYPSELYDSLGWNKREWETCCKAAGRTRASGLQGIGKVSDLQKRVECVWMNY